MWRRKCWTTLRHSLKVKTVHVKINRFVHIFVDLHWKPSVFILHTTLFSYHWLKGIFIDRVSIACGITNHETSTCYFFSVSGRCRIPKRLLYTVFNFKLTLTEEINRQKLCIWTNNHTEMFLCRFSMRFKKSKTSNTGHSMSETKFTWQRTKSLIFDNFVLSLGIKLINYRLFSGFIR